MNKKKELLILTDKKINFDVAMVSMYYDPGDYVLDKFNPANLKQRFYYGEVGVSGLDFFNQFGFSGVVKDYPQKTAFPIRNNSSIPAIVRKTRMEGVNVLADRLSDLIK